MCKSCLSGAIRMHSSIFPTQLVSLARYFPISGGEAYLFEAIWLASWGKKRTRKKKKKLRITTWAKPKNYRLPNLPCLLVISWQTTIVGQKYIYRILAQLSSVSGDVTPNLFPAPTCSFGGGFALIVSVGVWYRIKQKQFREWWSWSFLRHSWR